MSSSSAMSSNSFQGRLKAVTGPGGYESCMRRSVQTCILYEAKRMVLPHLEALRPFQRKFAFMDQAKALLHTIDFIPTHERDVIFYRTLVSKEHLKPDVAWKRAQAVDRELELLSHQIKPYCSPERTHEQTVNLLVRDLFVQQQGGDEKARSRCVPVHWEHVHKHFMMAYRLYYNGWQLDPTFPAAKLIKNLSFPVDKPGRQQGQHNNPPRMLSIPPEQTIRTPPNPTQFAATVATKQQQQPMDMAANITGGESQEDRRKLLAEVREHLDILKEFEGTISPEDLAERKRQLFLALPPAPPPAAGHGNKKPRT